MYFTQLASTKWLLAMLLLGLCLRSRAQTATLFGKVTSENHVVEFVQVALVGTKYHAATDSAGEYAIKNILPGTYLVSASSFGYERMEKTVEVQPNETRELNFELISSQKDLDEIVITGTKVPTRQTNSPVIVNVINSKTIGNVQACNFAEALRFQPGLRVEVDCQTCNYTQLRMNGLAGGYAQILINGRPIFSPLTGLYGLEQLPANMIDRVEVVRGGGSSLYGSSAIAGTVNLITKVPRANSHSIDYSYHKIGGQTNDHIINGNATLVSENKKSGASIFFTSRDRGFYDANGDHFSEIPIINNTSLGTTMFFLPNNNQKLEVSLSHINEFRYGGEMVIDEKPAYLAQQSEERSHNVLMANADYQINFNQNASSFIAYLAWQHTKRSHFTGILPNAGTQEYQLFVKNPPYGNSLVSTVNAGVQLNHRVDHFLIGKNVFTLGAEYIVDDVLDQIPTYNFKVDQTTKNVGSFIQSDWEIFTKLTMLSGVRIDLHNFVKKPIINPRAAVLYKPHKNIQVRLSYGTGFRAPQAFDTDLHIAFAAGGVSRISLSPELIQENSQSWSASVNYDKPFDNWITGFTIEAFHNRLINAFFLQPIGRDEFGERFEKRNGSGAVVRGVTFEWRANFNRKFQVETGLTIQSSRFDEAVQYIEAVKGIRDFVRTPNDYGYAIFTYTPTTKWNTTINYLYTGRMLIPHFAGAPNQTNDEIKTTTSFSELGAKIGYTLSIAESGLEIYVGVKNMFNAYQSQFDVGKHRDSGFVYGPAQPRTIFVGLKLKSL